MFLISLTGKEIGVDELARTNDGLYLKRAVVKNARIQGLSESWRGVYFFAANND